MTTRVTRAQFDTDFGQGGEVEITIRRGVPSGWADPNDIPADFLVALDEWLSTAKTRTDDKDHR